MSGGRGGLICLVGKEEADGLAELFYLVGLGDDPAETILLKIGHNRIIGIAAGGQSPDLRINFFKGCQCFPAPHASGNGEIHDDASVGGARLSGLVIPLHGGMAILDAVRLAAEKAEHLAEHLKNDLLVIHEQESAMLCCGLQGVLLFRDNVLAGCRQVDSEGCAVVRLRLDADMAAMVGDNGVGDGQTKTAARLFLGKIGVENFADIFLADAVTLILKDDLDIFAGRQVEDIVVGNINIGGLDGQDAALRHGLAGINGQILGHLAELALVRLHRQQIVR